MVISHTGPASSTDFYSKRKDIASVMHQVADPEIPVVSIVDLGMVINIGYDNNAWFVELAPTYSGCPALDVIPILAKMKLMEAGWEDVRVEMKLTPPWSTDWISESGKEKLSQFGIAPPDRPSGKPDNEGRPKQCPQCGSTDTLLISSFGSTPCKAAYKCLTCLEPFDYFKCY